MHIKNRFKRMCLVAPRVTASKQQLTLSLKNYLLKICNASAILTRFSNAKKEEVNNNLERRM